MSDNPHGSGQARPLFIALRVSGGGLLLATGAVHLDLYLTGYRTIPTIGWLFLLQIVTAFALGAAILATGSRLLASAGAGFAVSTLGGYLLTLWVGLFDFREVRTTAGIVAGVIEIAAFAALALLAGMPRGSRAGAETLGDSTPRASSSPGGGPRPSAVDGEAGSRRTELLERLRSGIPGIDRAVAAATVVAAAVLVVSVATSGAASTSPPVKSGTLLEVRTVGGKSVLTNSRGFTLYWFAPDTPTMSKCGASCAAYWPPVTGRPTAGPGVSGALGTIVRGDGVLQATYDRHPLYTYIGDSAPGQANGNGLDLNGGLWHEVAVSG